MKIISPRIIEVLTARCGFAITNQTVVHEEGVIPSGLWDNYYDDCLGRKRTMQVLQRPNHISNKGERNLVRSLMGAFKIFDNAPTEAIRESAINIIDDLCTKPRISLADLCETNNG
jgi:hypothetical protein